MTPTNTSADTIGLVVSNERDFYSQYARPFCMRHALLTHATNHADLAATMETEWRLLAEYALDFYRFSKSVSRDEDEGRIHETPELLAGIESYLRSHYRPAEFDPQKTPCGGDLAQSVPAWQWGLTGDALGVLGGYPMADPGSASVMFNASAFRGKSHKYNTGPEYVSCSGGPGTISTETAGMFFSGIGAVQRFWRWREMPRARGGVSYDLAVPIWIGNLNRPV